MPSLFFTPLVFMAGVVLAVASGASTTSACGGDDGGIAAGDMVAETAIALHFDSIDFARSSGGDVGSSSSAGPDIAFAALSPALRLVVVAHAPVASETSVVARTSLTADSIVLFERLAEARMQIDATPAGSDLALNDTEIVNVC